MYDYLLKFHSHNRNLIFLLLLLAIGAAIVGLIARKPWSKFNKISSLIAMVILDIQFALGMILYFGYSPLGFKAFSNDSVNVMKDKAIREIAVEHFILMLIAWILVHLGYGKMKKSNNPHRTIALFYSISLVLILFAIPWSKL